MPALLCLPTALAPDSDPFKPSSGLTPPPFPLLVPSSQPHWKLAVGRTWPRSSHLGTFCPEIFHLDCLCPPPFSFCSPVPQLLFSYVLSLWFFLQEAFPDSVLAAFLRAGQSVCWPQHLPAAWAVNQGPCCLSTLGPGIVPGAELGPRSAD